MATNNNTHQFRINYKSHDNKTYEGTFTVKRLSISDRTKVAVRCSQLLGGMYCVVDEEGNPTGQGIDGETYAQSNAIAHLEIALIQKPQWFDLENIYDLDLLAEIYKEVGRFERSFFLRNNGSKDENRESSRGSQNDSVTSDAETGLGNDLKEMVGQEIQNAMDP